MKANMSYSIKITKHIVIALVIIACAGFIFTMYSQSINSFLQDSSGKLSLNSVFPKALDKVAMAAEKDASATASNHHGGTIDKLKPTYSSISSGDSVGTQGEVNERERDRSTPTATVNKTVTFTIAQNIIDAVTNLKADFKLKIKYERSNQNYASDGVPSALIEGYATVTALGQGAHTKSGYASSTVETEEFTHSGSGLSANQTIIFKGFTKSQFTGTSGNKKYIFAGAAISNVSISYELIPKTNTVFKAGYGGNVKGINDSGDEVTQITIERIVNKDSNAIDSVFSSTAVANDGFYFTHWSYDSSVEAVFSDASRKIELPEHYKYHANYNTFNANFQEINVTNKISEFTFNGSGQGPSITDIPGYQVVNKYKAITTDSFFQDINTSTNAGDYNYLGEIRKNENGVLIVVGEIRLSFKIIPATPKLTATGPFDLFYGENLGSKIGTYDIKATNANTSPEVTVFGIFSLSTTYSLTPSENTQEIILNFTPDAGIRNNYNTNTIKININVKKGRLVVKDSTFAHLWAQINSISFGQTLQVIQTKLKENIFIKNYYGDANIAGSWSLYKDGEATNHSTILLAGYHDYTAEFVPDNSGLYEAYTKTVTIVVNRAVVTFTGTVTLKNLHYGEEILNKNKTTKLAE
ncbi:MAG: hypothetical protein LBU04_07665, partial [Christensenellaceae bacterium]|nr:hypothetical protein [Christensenellaceae bacterium]